MLIELRDYIKSHGVVTETQLARAFDIEPSALGAMLSLLVKKKRIVVCNERPACQSSCGACAQTVPLCYQIAPSGE